MEINIIFNIEILCDISLGRQDNYIKYQLKMVYDMFHMKYKFHFEQQQIQEMQTERMTLREGKGER